MRRFSNKKDSYSAARGIASLRFLGAGDGGSAASQLIPVKSQPSSKNREKIRFATREVGISRAFSTALRGKRFSIPSQSIYSKHRTHSTTGSAFHHVGRVGLRAADHGFLHAVSGEDRPFFDVNRLRRQRLLKLGYIISKRSLSIAASTLFRSTPVRWR